MKKTVLSGIAAAAASVLWAVPTVKNVTLTQDSPKQAVLKFTLENGPAVVTIDFVTNVVGTAEWVSIGSSNFTNLVPANISGRRLEDGNYTLTWNCRKNWPDHEVAAMRAEVTAWALDNLPDYMAVDLTTPSNIVFYTSEEALPFGIKDDRWLTDFFLMKRMHSAGIAWTMGTPSYMNLRRSNEVPTVVTLSEDFYISVFETFEGQYKKVVKNSSYQNNSVKPIALVSYNSLRGTTDEANCWPQDGHAVGASSFFGILRGMTGLEFDLPTSCQWEFACRGGTSTPYIDGSDRDIRNATNTVSGLCRAFADYCVAKVKAQRPDPAIARGGTKLPNAYGLYDMLGNVWEWCLDYEPVSADFDGEDVVDYPGPASPSAFDGGDPCRVARGGSIYAYDSQLNSSFKNAQFKCTRQATDTGFRVACPAVIK